MTISTQDCKDFISQISHIIHSNNSDKWKRIKKYKQDHLILRDFEDQDGQSLIIAELNNTLFLYQLSAKKKSISNLKTNIPGSKFIGQDATEKDVFTFIAECIQNDGTIVDYDSSYNDDEDEQTWKDGKNPDSWIVWEKWSQAIKKSNRYNEHPLKDFFDNNDGNWGEFDLYYADENGETIKIDKKNLIQVFWIGMSDYDTSYRIYIFETKDHTLFLGCNNPD